MANTRGLKNDGRSSDLTFSWLLRTHGEQWLHWQQYAAEWVATQHSGTSIKLQALSFFFKRYLLNHAPYAVNVAEFFKGQGGHRCTSEGFKIALLDAGMPDSVNTNKVINHCSDFIDFVIEKHLSTPGYHGASIPMVNNPLIKSMMNKSTTETVKNPLPYRYIQDLREIICPTPKADPSIEKPQLRHFKHWTWAIQHAGQGNLGRGWLEVEPDVIDKTDPDCVWCTKEVTREVNGKTKKVTIHQIWSPVEAMAVFIKLHLPLRTYQVRMLDSGEADTYRYIDGGWVLNETHNFTLGSIKRPFAKGVFHRIHDSMTGHFSTGLYINTNKTADKNKDEFDRGYTIPWENTEVLYWLEKLRNWQEKYNPIEQPTDCATLLRKHTREIKSPEALRAMGEISFLFRDAAAKGDDKHKPIADNALRVLWYQLLLTLENQMFDRGIRLDNDERLRLVKGYTEDKPMFAKVATPFPLHSLRVSLITCYVMETNLPLPVISKLLAGHTRLLMTIYYTKITPSVMAAKMGDAEGELEVKSKQSIKNFLKDANMTQIQCKMVYHNEISITSALASRNPIGWEERSCGLCLVGGNTVKSDELSTLGGCWNGDVATKGAVPHGPENCVRCRWLITEAKYLPALVAHLNQISYKANQSANLAVELEFQKEQLLDEEFSAAEQGILFTKHVELQQIQRRYEKQTVESSDYAEDLIATFNLIQRINNIEEMRTDDDKKDKLIAVGDENDVRASLEFTETDSELLHLSLICDDAEFFPDLQDELRKTPAIEKRSRQLNRILMRKGFEPLFMEMDEKQQLIVANAMLRHMAKIADPDDKLKGYRKVSNYLETGEYLKDNNLINEGIKELSNQALTLLPFKIPSLLEHN